MLDQLDPGHLIKYRLYRQHAQPDGNAFVKDLKVLGRDMHRVIIIDNVTESFKHQPENAIYITTWYDDQDDRQLEELIPLLKGIYIYIYIYNFSYCDNEGKGCSGSTT